MLRRNCAVLAIGSIAIACTGSGDPPIPPGNVSQNTAAGGPAATALSSAGGSMNQRGAIGGVGSIVTGGTGGSVSTGGIVTTGGAAGSNFVAGLSKQSDILTTLRLANDYFMKEWPDPTKNINATHESNLWTRAVYFEGLMGLYGVEPDAARKASYHDYAVKWAEGHAWKLYGDSTSDANADDQCCGQTYIDLYKMDQPARTLRIAAIKANMDWVAGRTTNGDWTWIDAIQMGMPAFAKLGALYSDSSYWTKMHSMYANAKTAQGFYNTTDHLWWRDATFKTKKTPNGKQVYWSRGNGWVFAALTRVLDTISATEANRAEYVADFAAMAGALGAIQRSDGFWNVSLADPNDCGGPESTGTALFTYGMAWGIRAGILNAGTYAPMVTKAWAALSTAVHANGFLGYVQGTGSQPLDGQPVTFDSVPNYGDFGVGCLLLAGSEVYKLALP